MKIAVIGSGISGLSTAWLLRNKYDVTLFEQNNYLGGHSNTATIDYNGQNIAVDTGFIVFNFKTYPNLKAFFELLGVKITKSNMSFAIKNLDNGFEYSGNNLAGLFAQKKNLFNLKFLKMLKDIIIFNKSAIKLVESKKDLKHQTLSQFIDDLKLGKYFKDYYLYPMAAAIWSCPLELIKNYPAKTFLQFFYNHGLLTVINQPQWYSVCGGSKNYVKKISDDLSDKIKLNCKIIKANMADDKVILTDDKNNDYEFDHVIFASHANQSLDIISDKNSEEAEILSKIKFSKNQAILHKSLEQMPKNHKAWASWVYLSSQQQEKVALSYWMNNLQNIDKEYPLFVTLNPIEQINEQDIFAKYNYEHPIFDNDAIIAQEKLLKIQTQKTLEQNKMWFCGAWMKYGFHEDGLNSAIAIAKKFGVTPPWSN